jgi:hypothetical protein
VRYTTKQYKYIRSLLGANRQVNTGSLANIDVQLKSENVVDAKITEIELSP